MHRDISERRRIAAPVVMFGEPGAYSFALSNWRGFAHGVVESVRTTRREGATS
jgi:hypothetical protein